MPLSRDFAFVVDRAVPAATILRAARRQGADHGSVGVRRVRRQGIGEGKKSVAIAVTLQPTDKTLTDEEIEKVAAMSSRR